ncbi:hypothetical protein KY289_027004 [Solanum tuberosum]|nr:hypothetical protein KY289_027004 [Solanum tuberosum]
MTGKIDNCTESLQVIINKWHTASNKVIESVTPPLEGINIQLGKAFEQNPDILHEQWTHPDNQIENCTESLQVIINKWYTASNKVVESVTPPLEVINIPVVGTVIKTSPFKEKSDKTGTLLTIADINPVVEQNNYSNQILHVISTQIEDTKPTISRRPTPASTSSNHNTEPNPGWKNPDKVSTLQDKSILLQKLSNDHFHNRKNFHCRPSFPDLQYEENAFLSTSSHEGRSITEWNIDGLAEHQIYNKLHEMGVDITAYKMRGFADKKAATMIAAGFTGMIKHWWDNYCNDETKHLIINVTAMEKVVKVERGTQSTSQVTTEDASATLLYHIAKHFIGDPKLFKDRNLQILNNLSCPNLDNFIHYKHAFLNKGLNFAQTLSLFINLRKNIHLLGENLEVFVETLALSLLLISTPQNIRVLSDHSKEALFYGIHHIADDEARNRFLLELKNIILNTDKPKSRPIVKPFRMKQIMSRLDSHSESSISNLRNEISNLKDEIKNIKSRLGKVKMYVLTDQVLKKATLQEPDSGHESTQDDECDSINNDHLIKPNITNTGNNPSSSTAPGVTRCR